MSGNEIALTSILVVAVFAFLCSIVLNRWANVPHEWWRLILHHRVTPPSADADEVTRSSRTCSKRLRDPVDNAGLPVLIRSYDRAVLAVLLFIGSAQVGAAQDASFKLEICQSCHGESGRSQMSGVPPLAGRDASELATQLKLFRNGQRQNPQMVMAKRLTDDEVEELAAFFAKQSSKWGSCFDPLIARQAASLPANERRAFVRREVADLRHVYEPIHKAKASSPGRELLESMEGWVAPLVKILEKDA
jgi:cytochrome c553